jgi:hypothetical protein
MKKIWHLLRNHLIADFNFKHYASVAGLIVTGITFNYTFDFEETYLEHLAGILKFGAYFSMYSFFYLAGVCSYFYWHRRWQAFTDRAFWVYSLFGLILLSLDSSVPFLYPVIEEILPAQVQFWSFKVATNLISFFIVFLPLIIFHFLREKQEKSIYGLQPKQFDAKPYFLMLAIMLPMIIGASFHQSFLRQYPMYRDGGAHHYLGSGEWLTIGGYEIAYGLDFITVEYLFRGFFVIAMARFLDRGAVLLMAVLYCTLHFGKPMGEAISSVFGGYILGSIAFETRSIWGGVIVHMGIAWMMEGVAFLQKI